MNNQQAVPLGWKHTWSDANDNYFFQFCFGRDTVYLWYSMSGNYYHHVNDAEWQQDEQARDLSEACLNAMQTYRSFLKNAMTRLDDMILCRRYDI